MKNTIRILLLALTVLSCRAQIIPVENYIDYRTNEIEIPDGAYIKDVNNLFDKYIGTWTANYNGNDYKFKVEKTVYQSSIRSLTRDELLIRYKIVNATTNQVIVNTFTLPNDSPFVIEGDYLDENGDIYHLNYNGLEAICGQNGYILITVINNGTQMKFAYIINGEMALEECPNGVAEQVFPLFLTLDKQ